MFLVMLSGVLGHYCKRSNLFFPCLFQLFPLNMLTFDLPHSILGLRFRATEMQRNVQLTPFECTKATKRPYHQTEDLKVTFLI